MINYNLFMSPNVGQVRIHGELRVRSNNWFWTVLAAAAIGCGQGDTRRVSVADTAGRDLQLAPVDSSAALGDVSRPETTAVAPEATPDPTPAPPPKSAAARPSTPAKPAAPAVDAPVAPAPAPAPPPAPRSLDAGTKFSVSLRDSITSASNKAGDVVVLRVAADVSDAEGRVVIPAGSTVKARIAAIKWSENKGDKGTLRLEPTSVAIEGESHDVAGLVANPTFTYTKRGSVLGDAAKPAAGAAAGAVVGGLIGKGTGAVIGGVVGGAVGTQRMVETKDRDIVVASGSTTTVELTSEFIHK